MFTYTLLTPRPSSSEIGDDSYDPTGSDAESDSQTTYKGITRASLLRFGQNLNILADPGWDGKCDLSFLESVIPTIDVILLSQTTKEHLGAFALLQFKFPILQKIPVYATLPVTNLGKVTTIELYRSCGATGPLDTAFIEQGDIEQAFNRITPLKYSQSVSVGASGASITAYNAGHTLGGSFWLITKDTEKVIYAPTWNHSKDSFLNAAKLVTPYLLRPTTLITGTDLGTALPYKKKVEKFIVMVQATIQNGGSVILPTTVAGRMFELLPLIDQNTNNTIPVLLLCHSGTKALAFASNMLEWMSPEMLKQWESKGQAPYDVTQVRLVSPEELVRLEGPKVVFCSDSDLEEGSQGRSCLLALSSRPNSTIILTERPSSESFSSEIYETWSNLSKKSNNGKLEDGIAVPLEKAFHLKMYKEELLDGLELSAYKKNLHDKRQRQRMAVAADRKNEELLLGDGEILGDSSESEEEHEDDDIDEDGDGNATTTTAAAAKNDKNKEITLNAGSAGKEVDSFAGSSIETLLKTPMDFDVRNAKGRNRMFPFVQKKIVRDDYGIVINANEFSRKEDKFGGFEQNQNSYNQRKRNLDRGVDDDETNKKKKLNKEEIRQQEEEQHLDLDPLKNPRRREEIVISLGTRCGLTFIDLAGSVDLRSMMIIINSLKPKKVLLIPERSISYGCGLKEVTSAIEQQQQKLLVSAAYTRNNANPAMDMITVVGNSPVSVGSVITSYEVSLDEKLEQALKWQKIAGGYSIAHVVGEIAKSEPEEGDNTSLNPKNLVLRTLPSEVTSSALVSASMGPLAIGDIRLAELKRKLAEINMKAEFKGDGALVINNQLAVRKISDSDLVIEGMVGELFYDVRKIVQNMLAYV
ncbi:unnamed protein product [Kuraishia capsulata CBS 1993]|uniref:Cleavage and polyadenylation specificity factor subunit 2 n=1 Tax=Kuraishia capsulata CBS 1993 TaxID=1382522 RepID=W6MF19_9ASCO|nr:uncharacterized protein KUCA_T00000079001 [Kuraishia capsulata CBS 1993]CDK24119.1 unnamed protein product [Kuraishia capsulata CBS 1993]